MKSEMEIKQELESLYYSMGKLNNKYFGRSASESYYNNKQKLQAKISLLEWVLE